MMRGLPEECSAIDTFLRNEGFDCSEQEPDGVEYSLWRYYSKDFTRIDSNVRFSLVIRFTLRIYDAPGGSYDDNHTLFYEDSYLTVYDRQMIDEGGLYAGEKYYDEETESQSKVDSFEVRVSSYPEIENLVATLS